MAQFIIIIILNIWRSFLCYPPCPSWPSNLKNHITFDLKISYVKKLPCLEAHSIPYSQKKFQKITAILDASSSMTKSPKSHFGAKRALGVNEN
jgi:hypothetical protein